MNYTLLVAYNHLLLFFESDTSSLTVLFVLFCVGLILYFVFRGEAKEKAPPKKDISHGSAEWANQDQMLNAGFNNEHGLWIGYGYRYPKHGHLLTVASSGEGKGTCVIIPNLLSYPGDSSFVITDPKGELANITARAQKKFGQKVIILDPWDEQAKIGATHDIRPSGFNPFDFIRYNMDELQDTCEQIAYFLVPDKPDVKDPFWNDRARSMIKSILLEIVTNFPPEGQNFWSLYQMVRYNGDQWVKMLERMADNPALDGLISSAANEYLGFGPTNATLNSIKSSAQNATTIFESPQLRASLEKSNFNPYNLTDGKYTVYIVMPERFIDTHAPWLRMVIGLCLKACNAKPNKRVYYMLDEFAILGKMRDIQRGFAFARGQNIVLWIFAQSLSQLKEIYGEDGMNSFISNAAVLQFFGIKDQYTREFISKYLGEGTITKREEAFSSSNSKEGKSTSSSENYNKLARSLLTPEEVGKEPWMIVISEMIKFRLPRVSYKEFPEMPKDEPLDVSKFSNNVASYIVSEIDNQKLELNYMFKESADEPQRIVI